MALARRISFTRFDRWGTNLGRIGYTAATYEEDLDGTDELKITCDSDFVKGDRIVWIDQLGCAHEHIVDSFERTHDDEGEPSTTVTGINSVAELWDDYIEDKRPSGSAAVALASILEGTRWEVGVCDVTTIASHTFYHMSVREALGELLDTWGGELEVVIETDGFSITHRYINIRVARGNQRSPKRFTWTKDITRIKRKTGSDNPKTRVYGYGKGVETESGGYGRRLTFGDINGGKDYVEDAAATEVWGHPDGSGGTAPAVDVYVNEQCEDAVQLLAETRDYLETVKAPQVSYEADVIDLYAFGRSWEGVALGDSCAIIDKEFSAGGIRLKGRVSKLKRDLVTNDTTVTFGNLTDALTDIFASISQQLKGGSAQRASYDAVAGTSVSWLNQLMSALNQAFNAVGTYKVESFELGTIYSNVALNPETGTPVKSTSGMWAVNINGMGIRLAAGLTAAGEWDWRTFITGASVNADCINVGTMRADRVRAGLLTDEKGNNYWDLTTGEFKLSPSAKYGDGKYTIDGVISDLEDKDNQAASDIKDVSDGLAKSNEFIDSLKESLGNTDTKLGELQTSLGDLDSTVDDLAKDGVVTEAEKAAVNKILQTIEKEQSELSAEYSSLNSNTALATQYKTAVLTPQYTAAFGTNGAYDELKDKIDAVTSCITKDALDAAMIEYKSAFDSYSSKVNSYRSAARQAKSMIEQSKAKATAEGLLSDFDESLNQQDIFNRLTNNGATQGIYMKNGKVYINAAYIAAGTISDTAGRNSWNLATGEFKTTKGTIGGFTIGYYEITNNTLSLRSNGMHFIHDSNDIGFVGTNGLVGYTGIHGLNFDLNENGHYMTWAAKSSASDTVYNMKWTYCNRSGIGFTYGALNAGCDIDMRNWSIKNIGNGCTNTLYLSVLTNIMKDGSYTFANGCKLVFEGGLLKNFTWLKDSYS